MYLNYCSEISFIGLQRIFCNILLHCYFVLEHVIHFACFQARLIASVPGYHTGASLKRWGHMKLRCLLQECTFDEEFKNSPLVYQVLSRCIVS